MTRSPPALRILALAATAASCLAVAGPVSAAARQCFFTNELSNWTADDKGGVVYLRIGVSDVYEVKLLGACPDLHWAERIGIETRGGGAQICSGLDVAVVVPRSEAPTGPQRCFARSVRKLTPDEVKALPAKLRP